MNRKSSKQKTNSLLEKKSIEPGGMGKKKKKKNAKL